MKNLFSILKSPALWTMVTAVVLAGVIVKAARRVAPESVTKYLP